MNVKSNFNMLNLVYKPNVDYFTCKLLRNCFSINEVFNLAQVMFSLVLTTEIF